VAIGFVVFLGVLGYLGVHRMIGKALDDRRDRIKAALDEAAKLKADAMALLTEYQKKRAAAETEAQSIIAGARAEAERFAVEAKAKAAELVGRATTVCG